MSSCGGGSICGARRGRKPRCSATSSPAYMAIVPWDDPVNYGAHVSCAVSTYGTLRTVGAVRHARDGDARRAREGGFSASVVNRPPVKLFNRGPGTEMPCRASLCRVVRRPRRAPICPDTQDRAGVDQVLCYFSPGASHRCQAVTHVALQSQPGTATHSFALMDHFRGERHDSPSRPGHRRHATSLSRHSQHDMP